MKLRQSARILKALASLRASVIAFNGLDDDGQVTEVLLRMQHSFEMLMKALVNERGITVFDKSGKSIGLDKALNLGQNDSKMKLTDDDAGLIRAIDAMRDEEQHGCTTVGEGLRYMHIRAGVTLFDDMLNRAFGERLGSLISRRMLPIGAEPPRTFSVLRMRSSSASVTCSSQKRRMGVYAKGRIRTLLAMEAHNDPDTLVSDKGVDRAMQGITEGRTRGQVFPILGPTEKVPHICD